MRLFVAYDSNVLRLKEVRDLGTIQGANHYQGPDFSNPYILMWSNTLAQTDNTFNGEIAILRFEILAEAGNSPISLSYGNNSILNSNGVQVPFEVENGSVSAGAAPATRIMLSPSHAILSKTSESVEFTAVLTPENSKDFDNIVWEVVGDPLGNILNILPSSDNQSVEISAVGPAPLGATTMVVKAVYENIYTGNTYTATATVEILPSEWTAADPVVKVLEKKVTVNKAKILSARVPVLITGQPPANIGLKAYDAGQGGGSFSAFDAITPGALAVQDVRLMIKDKKGNWNEVDKGQFTAGLCQTDDRYIEIYATLKATSKKKVRVDLLPVGATQWIEAISLIELSVVEKYPKITFAYDKLNMFNNIDPSTKIQSSPETLLTAKAADGSTVTVDSVAYAASKDKKIVNIHSDNKTLEAIKKGTANLKATVTLDGYHRATKSGKPIKATVKVTNTLPKLKLSKASVPLLKTGSPVEETTNIQLLTADKKVPFESSYKVENVTCTNGLVDVLYHDGGALDVTPNTKTKKGTANLLVTFEGSTKTVKLKLKITKVVGSTGVKASVKTKALTVQMGHEGKITDIPITLNVPNIAPDDWAVNRIVKGGKTTPEWPVALNAAVQPVYVEPGANMVTLKADTIMLTALMDAARTSSGAYKNLKYTLYIASSKVSAPVKIAVTITAKTPSFTVAKKGKVDIANPNSAITATVKLKNTTSGIEEVKLLDKAGGSVSSDFEAVLTGANTFTVKIKDGSKLAPGVTKKPVVEIKLENELTTMTKAISIAPKQTAGKKVQSRSSITLYKAQPLQGETVSLNLKAPVSLGAVQIQQASLNKMKFDTGGFELVRNGENDWTIIFKDGKAPTKLNKKNKDVLKSSYTLKLELWAEGTYIDDSGKAAPIKDGKKASKPTVVKVKVYIK